MTVRKGNYGSLTRTVASRSRSAPTSPTVGGASFITTGSGSNEGGASILSSRGGGSAGNGGSIYIAFAAHIRSGSCASMTMCSSSSYFVTSCH